MFPIPVNIILLIRIKHQKVVNLVILYLFFCVISDMKMEGDCKMWKDERKGGMGGDKFLTIKSKTGVFLSMGKCGCCQCHGTTTLA